MRVGSLVTILVALIVSDGKYLQAPCIDWEAGPSSKTTLVTGIFPFEIIRDDHPRQEVVCI